MCVCVCVLFLLNTCKLLSTANCVRSNFLFYFCTLVLCGDGYFRVREMQKTLFFLRILFASSPFTLIELNFVCLCMEEKIKKVKLCHFMLHSSPSFVLFLSFFVLVVCLLWVEIFIRLLFVSSFISCSSSISLGRHHTSPVPISYTFNPPFLHADYNIDSKLRSHGFSFWGEGRVEVGVWHQRGKGK